MDHFYKRPPKGEITLVIGREQDEAPAWDDLAVKEALDERLAAGDSPTEAARAVAKLSGRPRRQVYRLAIDNN